ncbi:MAG: TetR/AcrR family transcriptional regulator [Acidimicrobiales bacterium]
MVKGRLPGPQRRRQILSVARAVLAQNGYHGTTMSDIAEAAGVTKPVLYQHFASKRELYRTVLEDIGARLEASVVEAASAASSPRTRAEAGIRAYAKFVEEDEDGFELLFNGTNRQDDEWSTIIEAVERSLAQAVASMIDVPAISGQRRQILAHGIIGLAESMMRFARADDDLVYSHDELVRDLTELTWSGLRGLEA